jgi:hypothetical protein
MRLVAPRPAPRQEVERSDQKYPRIFQILPGMTDLTVQRALEEAKMLGRTAPRKRPCSLVVDRRHASVPKGTRAAHWSSAQGGASCRCG